MKIGERRGGTRDSLRTLGLGAADHEAIAAAEKQLRAEYAEMPGMRLTFDQVRRLCGIEASACRAALEKLVAAKFLSLHPSGVYARRTDEERHARMTMARPRRISR